MRSLLRRLWLLYRARRRVRAGQTGEKLVEWWKRELAGFTPRERDWLNGVARALERHNLERARRLEDAEAVERLIGEAQRPGSASS